jgi:hypothetical protein
MYVIDARNVNDAYRKGLRLLASESDPIPSRNGPVLRVTDMVATVYQRPIERVLFSAQRDANPFFHLFEALWMLNGGNDVQALSHILPSFAQFSDDGVTFHGAYGHRWRHWPDHTSELPYMREQDQLSAVIEQLRKDPTSRRAVIAMWCPNRDLGRPSKDLPCNNLINLGIRNGALNISVTCRSNDIIYGCYGANAVHMSMLHEYLAAMMNAGVGVYTQISFDYHAYIETPYHLNKYWPFEDAEADVEWTDEDVAWVNPYDNPNRANLMCPHVLVDDPATFDKELGVLMRHVRAGSVSWLDGNLFENSFFKRIAIPMHYAFEEYKQKNLTRAKDILIAANEHLRLDNDWLIAGIQWIERRVHARAMQQYNEMREAIRP